MSLETDVNTVETDASKVDAVVTKDVATVEADVKSFWDKTYSAKIVVLVGVGALVVGFLAGKVL